MDLMNRRIIIQVLTFVSVLLLSTVIFALVGSRSANAAIAEKVHTRTFFVEENAVRVQESKKVSIVENGFQVPKGSAEGFTIFNPVEGAPNAEEAKQIALDSIEVKDDRGQILSYTIEETDSQNYIVKVPHPRDISFRQSSEIFLSYISNGLLVKTGAVKDIYIPGFPEEYVFETNQVKESVLTTVSIPKDAGTINFVSPDIAVSNQDDNRIIQINQEQLLGNSVWIQIGTEQYFEFEIKQLVPKTNNFPFAINTFTLPLPRDVDSGPITQRVHYSSISPKPYSVTTDEEGNLLATFKLSASIDHTIEIKGYAMLIQDVDYEFGDSGKLSDIPKDFGRYLESAEYWEVNDPVIQEAANSLSDSDDINEIVQTTYNFVVNRINYSFVKKYGLNERQGALATLNGGAAVCMEYSDLFITLLRAQGVPARAAFGFAYGASDYESQEENRINHQWAEVYLPSLDTWINVDTTWGEFGNTIIGGDLNHLYSHVAAVDPETPSTSELAFFGDLSEIPERDMSIFIIAEEPSFNEHMSQDELIETYSEPEGIEKIAKIIETQFGIINTSIDNFNSSIFGVNTSSIHIIVKLIVIATVVVLIVWLIRRLWRIVFKRRKSDPRGINSLQQIQNEDKKIQ
jgi:hypothetical protein